MKAGDRPVHVTAGIIKMATGPAGDLVEIQMLAAPAASWTEEPGPGLVVPHDRHAVPVRQNIGSAPGEPVPPVPRSELRNGAFAGECAGSIELE